MSKKDQVINWAVALNDRGGKANRNTGNGVRHSSKHKPTSIPDCLEVYELAHKQWEQNRLRKYSPALVKGALVRALGVFLGRFPALSRLRRARPSVF